MKAIINKKRYDTETAEFIAEWSNTPDRGDVHWIQEELYRTSKGAYFIYGQGGAFTEYAEWIDRSARTEGSAIRPGSATNLV